MAALLLAFLTTLVIGGGGRAHGLAAGLARRRGAARGLLPAMALAVLLAAALAGLGGLAIGSRIPAAGRLLLLGLAFIIAGAGMTLPSRAPSTGSGRLPLLPTAFILTAAHAIADNGLFLTFAIAAYWLAPLMAAIGGAAGLIAVLAIGIARADLATHAAFRPWRTAAGFGFVVTGFTLSARALGLWA